MHRHFLVSAYLMAAVTSAAYAQQSDRLDTYIVMLNPGAGAPAGIASEVARRANGEVGFVYGALGGFSINLPPAAAQALERDPRVAMVAREGVREIVAQTIPTGINRTFAPTYTANSVLMIDGTDDLRVDADVAIIDSGIDVGHTDLNVVGGINCVVKSGGGPSASYSCSAAASYSDDNGHGTHVAGTVGAIDNGQDVVGIAPGVRLLSVKVCDNRGRCPDSQVIAGLDWVVQRGDVEVANMSLSGPVMSSDPYKPAIDAAVSAGLVVVVAAGNDGHNANLNSPAYVPSAITVSALADYNGIPDGTGTFCTTSGPFGYSGPEEHIASFSNYGSAIDIAAPGVCILSTARGGGTELNIGTSMASPHVAGAAAVVATDLRRNGSSLVGQAFVDAVTTALTSAGNYGYIHESGTVPEPLLDISLFEPLTVPGNDGVDTVSPMPVLSSVPSPTNLTVIPVSVSFGEDVTGFEAGDLTVINGTVSNFSGTGADYTFDVTVNPQTDGTIVLVDISAGAAQDLSSNLSLAANTLSITYNSGAVAGITIDSAIGRKVKGIQHVDLTWSGATTAVDIFRNGFPVTTGTENDGSYTDNIGAKGGGSYDYQICETGTSSCSATINVTF